MIYEKKTPAKQTKKNLIKYLRLVQNKNWNSHPVIRDAGLDTLHPLILPAVSLIALPLLLRHLFIENQNQEKTTGFTSNW